jgi:hypothetical protein
VIHYGYVPATEPRVYRHVPWLVATVLLVLLLVVLLVPLAGVLIHDPSVRTVAGTLLWLAFTGALGSFLVLSWRVRTVVDEHGVTQHWVTRSFRIRYADITAVERENVPGRWFLRLHCGERTFEVIPCQSLPFLLLPGHGRPPKALTAAHADITAALKTEP